MTISPLLFVSEFSCFEPLEVIILEVEPKFFKADPSLVWVPGHRPHSLTILAGSGRVGTVASREHVLTSGFIHWATIPENP